MQLRLKRDAKSKNRSETDKSFPSFIFPEDLEFSLRTPHRGFMKSKFFLRVSHNIRFDGTNVMIPRASSSIVASSLVHQPAQQRQANKPEDAARFRVDMV